MSKRICSSCGGTGRSDDGPCSPPGVCSECNGTGKTDK
jgi:DnaJ-class molecular chaperone